MKARSWFLFALLASPLLAPALAASEHAIDVPPARAGDRAVYAAPRSTEGSLAFEWESPAKTTDRWGVHRAANVLRTELPWSALDPGAASDEWTQHREAFALSGGTLLWRSQQTEQSRGGDVLHSDPVRLPATAEVREDIHLDRATYDPTPLVRTCFAHHGLQGQRVAAGQVVALETLCPAVTALEVRSEAGPALATTFLGRTAVELRYRMLDAMGRDFDVPLPSSGWLRVVLAEGIPFLAEVQASGTVSGGAWHEVLASVREGSGPEVPTSRSADGDGLEARPGARFAPLTVDGPADGDSGLPYPLGQAVASVRADLTLVGFQAWLREHPGAFVVRAVYQPRNAEGAAWANWILYFGGPRGDGWVDVYSLDAYRAHAEAVPEPAAQRVPASYNMDGIAGQPAVADPPDGALTLVLASALRAWPFAEAMPTHPMRVAKLTYDAPASGAPAQWTVEQWSGSGTALEGAVLSLDASNGAALELLTSADEVSVSNVEVGDGTLRLLAEERPGSEESPLTVAAVAGAAATAAALALLAHGGYLTAAYSRLRGSDLLKNPTRRRIYELVRDHPGIHFNAVVAAVGGGRGSTTRHLRVLERSSLVTRATLLGYRRYYLPGSVPHGHLQQLAELAGGRARHVYELVRAEPGLSLSELARRVGVTPPAVAKIVERLERVGLVVKWLEGREARVAARDPAGLN